MEFEPEDNDYNIYGDIRNPKGKLELGYNKHSKGHKEQKRIFYIKEKRMQQSQVDREINEMKEEINAEKEPIEDPKKRKLKYTAKEGDEEYGNNYTPIENKTKKKKNSKKDKVRF